MRNTNNHHHNSSHLYIHSYPAHSYLHVLAHINSPGHSTPVTSVNSPLGYNNPIPNSITFPIDPISTFKKGSVSNAVISILIGTVKNNEVPGIVEAVLNPLLVANGLPQFKMDNVSPPSSFPPNSTDSASLNTQSTSTPSPSLPTNRQQRRQMITLLRHLQCTRKKEKKINKGASDQQIYQSSLVKTGSSSSL